MKRILRDVLLPCLLLAPLAHGGPPPATPQREESLDEVVVNGTKLNEIMQEIVKSEDRFFARYNELNTNDDFDMHCAREARIGTAIRGRACRAVYMNKAFETEGHDHLLARGAMCDPPCDSARTPWIPPVPPIMFIEARRKDFQQNMREVVRRNPELIKMLRERYELGKRYEAARRKVWDLKPLPAEETVVTAPMPP